MGWEPKIEIVDSPEVNDFLRKAYDFAWMFSEDEATKTGAVIVQRRNGRQYIVGAGWNHFKDDKKALIAADPALRQDRMWKRKNITHAEVAAIEDARAYGVDPAGLEMYMPWVPCKECAEAIVDAGIGSLYGHREMIIKSPDDWIKSLEDAIHHLEYNEKNHKVNLYMASGVIGGTKARFREQDWQP